MKNPRSQLYHDAKYFAWNRDAWKINLKRDEFNAFFDSLDPNKYVKGNVKTAKQPWLVIGSGAWKRDKKAPYEYIYLFKDHDLFIYSTNYMDDTKNLGQRAEPGMHISNKDETGGGVKALQKVKYDLRDEYSIDRKIGIFQHAFGVTDESFKRCIPKMFMYDSERDRIYNQASSADFCSMFASCLCGKLPDANTAITVDGCVKPTEEYPFAFYPESGHVAIDGEFDTRDWQNNPFCSYLFRDIKKSKDDEWLQQPWIVDKQTILMKASKYELTEIYKRAYADRKNDPNMKQIIVSSIGAMHMRNPEKYRQNAYAHLAAVAIARSSNKMLKVIQRNGLNRANIIQICVDGIIYVGNYSIGVPMKGLQVLNQEFTGCPMRYAGHNKYIVMDKFGEKVIKYKHGSCNCNTDGTYITDENVTCFEDIDRWVKIDSRTQQRDRFIEELDKNDQK